MTKTIQNTAFLPEQKITISGYEFAMYNASMEQMFENMRKTAYPIRYMYLDKDGEKVENWTKEQLESGEVTETLDPANTFNPKNAVEAYCGNITYTMLEAMRMKMEIHENNMKDAVTLEELVKEMEKRNAKIETIE